MTQKTAQLRQDLADTRERMSSDIDELRNRAKQRLDVRHVVREYPWSALGVAVALGAFIGRSGVDERAVSATRDAITDTVDKVRFRRHRNESRSRVVAEYETQPGIGDKFAGMLAATVATTLGRVVEEMRVASRDWGTRMSTSRTRAARAAVPVAPVVAERTITTNRAADVVPVPEEIAPAELGLRADAVEAVGGGTHEPPLEPGAGELGARWS